MAAIAWMFALVRAKSGLTARARCRKRVIAAYCTRASLAGNCTRVVHASGGTENSYSPWRCSAARLVTRMFRRGQVTSSSVRSGAANVPLGRARRLARVQTHANTHLHIGGPRISGKAALSGYCRRDRISSAGKGDEEGISLGIHFVTMPLLESGAQQLPACCKYACILLTHLLEELR